MDGICSHVATGLYSSMQFRRSFYSPYERMQLARNKEFATAVLCPCTTTAQVISPKQIWNFPKQESSRLVTLFVSKPLKLADA